MRYTFEITPGRTGYFTATDTLKGVSVTFLYQEFQDTQEWEFTPEAQKNTTVYLNRIADSLEAWVRLNHPEEVEKEEKFIVKRSEDGKRITIRRPKLDFDISFPSEFGKAKAASIIRHTAEWLKHSEGNWDNVDF